MKIHAYNIRLYSNNLVAMESSLLMFVHLCVIVYSNTNEEFREKNK